MLIQDQKKYTMKNIIVLLTVVFAMSFSYGQQENKLGLNEETELIEATYFHDNGIVSQVGTFNLDGKLHGEWTSFNKEGEKISEGRYVNGRKVGKWTFWAGNETKEVRYSNNEIASVDGVKKDGLVKN